MLKRLAVLFAAIELAFPRRLVAAAERLAFENPRASDLRSWTVPAARIEGAAFAALALRGAPLSPRVRTLTALVGGVMVLSPRRVVDAAMRVAYRDARAIRLRSWVVPATRVLGLVYVVVGLPGRTSRA